MAACTACNLPLTPTDVLRCVTCELPFCAPCKKRSGALLLCQSCEELVCVRCLERASDEGDDCIWCVNNPTSQVDTDAE